MKNLRYIFPIFVLFTAVFAFFAYAAEDDEALPFPLRKSEVGTLPSTPASAVDLPTPGNISESVEYDPDSETYTIRQTLDGEDITEPSVLTSDEYDSYSLYRSMRSYWRDRNGLGTAEKHRGFSLSDIHVNIGKAGEIFGPGGIQLKTQGTAEISMGLRRNRIQNPTLTERSQNPPPTFDFDEKIQLNVRGSVGDRIKMSLNYNTEASFDFDAEMIKLAYEGGEDDILQNIEVGNISMPLSTTLITGSAALFGMKTKLKFGRMTVDAVLSQQQSETRNVSVRGGAQTTDFELDIDEYDENRHFFLSDYFYANYNRAMSTLPYINSAVKINRIEVWVTNKRGSYSDVRNIVAFADLGEPTPSNPHWASGSQRFPANTTNSLYAEVTDPAFSAGDYTIRTIDGVASLLDSELSMYDIAGGEDYDKIENARMLSSSEYTFNPQLGYISLKSALNTDEVLAVAYEFTAGGQVYQVGEFASDVKAPDALVLKLLKGTNLHPESPCWHLMMKNVYSLGAFQVQQDKFELNVMFQSDSAGLYLNYLPNSPIEHQTLLSAMRLDRLDNMGEARPDGVYDFVPGVTIIPETGRIIFPTVEPFGSDFRHILGDNPAYDKYVYQELYDSTLVVAQQYSEKNKFKLKGQYKASSGSEIRLNAMNVPRGSVRVTAGGRALTENVDYTVDYAMGTVNIINTDILDSGETINVSMENQSFFNTQRRSLFGLHLNYEISKDFNVGATLMHMSEKPLTKKVEMGSEPISNTIWGFNFAYRRDIPQLTRLLNKFPLFNLNAPSSFAINGEFAQLIPGHAKVINDYSYIDDFEATKSGIDIRYAHNWHLASTPADDDLFPEAKLSNDLRYGYNRAKLAWYSIDPLFTRNNTSTPSHIKNDADQLSNHFVREVKEQEIYPARETAYGQSSYRTILNLAYYPTERGPYNFDLDVDDADRLNHPEKRWGGIMRRLDQTDFEKANIEYLEFWLMDPFIYDNTARGGDLYFDLGDISEDILKDGKKFVENALPATDDLTSTRIDTTAWGLVPRTQTVVSAFGTDALDRQDVGLNGLNSTQERDFYADFIAGLRARLSAETLAAMEADPFSPLNDPAGDDYHYFLGRDYDSERRSVLDRYKHYNGLEGNSHAEGSSKAATSTPDGEDINGDNTLNEYERFFQYRISLRPEDMVVGENFIADKVISEVELENGHKERVTWYQFKIPVSDYTSRVGNIRNFKSIRFVRLFLTDFTEETHLRFGSLELVRGEWRTYTKDLRYDQSEAPLTTAQLDVESVSIEENASKQPVNYILPPGIDRVVDPSQTQIRQENEQAMLMRVTNLAPKDSRAVYKTTRLDMRQYKRLKMFVHAEQFIDDDTNLRDGDLAVFIRLGSDHTNNFYEYEIPLTLTPAGVYSENVSGDAYRVWPTSNAFDVAFSKFTEAKKKRNATSWSLTEPYVTYDKEEGKRQNKITILGNPSISEVKVLMIGIRNLSTEAKNGEIWVNEMRLSDFEEDGGYAALVNSTLTLSDLAMVNFSGRIESSGFGSIEQSVQERNLDNFSQLGVSTSVEFGKFFPEKAHVHIPFYYSYTREVTRPEYDPMNQDLHLDDVLDAAPRSSRDSIRRTARDMQVNRSISLSNVKVDIQSKTPQLYDPTNFSLGYSYNENTQYDPETEYELTKNYKGYISYNFNTTPKPVTPFAKSKAFKGAYGRLVRDFNVNYMPSYISYINNINRYYYERQLRNLTGMPQKIDPSFSQDFSWQRNFDMKYDFSRSLKFSFSVATNSRIDEPYMVVNKDRYPDEYSHWKDSVWHSFRHGGRPMQYEQMFTVTYTLPINKIPFLDWVTSNAQYRTTYDWDRGVFIKDEDGNSFTLGNTASNMMNWQVDGRLNFETLYKHSSYLKRVNDKFQRRSTNRNNRNSNAQPKTYSSTVSLHAGEAAEIKHRLNSSAVKLTAVDADGRTHTLKYRTVDANTIRIKSKKDLENLTLSVTQDKAQDTEKSPTDYLSRVLMLIRNASATYKQTRTVLMPQYQPSTGFLGQRKFEGTKAPGYNFVFGFFKTDPYISDAHRHGWLGTDSIGDPLSVNTSTDLQLRLNLEPLPGFKVELNGYRTTAESRSILFDASGRTIETFSGSFSMTQAAIGTSFWKVGKTGNFDSRAFEDFKASRAEIAARIRERYAASGYDLDDYDASSAEVLIPAFLASYGNRSSSRVGLRIFPLVRQMMPNWKFTYDGLAKINPLKKVFKTISLTHAYRCVYNVGAYSSYLGWEAGSSSDLGFRTTALGDGSASRIASSRYDVSSVSLTEAFNPLFGVNVTTLSNISLKVEYKKSRSLNLNITSQQLVESNTHEWVIGAGYKFNDFNAVLKLKQHQTKVQNSLTLRTDFSIRDVRSIIRKLEEGYSEPESGGKIFKISFTADYVLSEWVNICFYFDKTTNAPFVSSSYPTRSWDGGLTLRLMLTQ